MQGRSHLLIGLAAGIFLDGTIHVSGPPLSPLLFSSSGPDLISMLADLPDETLLLKKTLYYSAVMLGALWPDVDHSGSTLGRKLGPISKVIHQFVGHRTLFHSILGLVLGALIMLGGEAILLFLLAKRDVLVPASLLETWHTFVLGVFFGSVMHILCDMMTKSGVPLLWPVRRCFGIPPWKKYRFKTGSWPEHVIVWITLLLLIIGIWTKFIII